MRIIPPIFIGSFLLNTFLVRQLGERTKSWEGDCFYSASWRNRQGAVSLSWESFLFLGQMSFPAHTDPAHADLTHTDNAG